VFITKRRLMPSALAEVSSVSPFAPAAEFLPRHRLARLLLGEAPKRVCRHVNLIGPNNMGAVFAHSRFAEQLR